MSEPEWVQKRMTDKKWVEQADDFLREASLFLYETPEGTFWDLMKRLSYPRHNPYYWEERWPRLPPKELRKLWQRAVEHGKQFDGDDPGRPRLTVIIGGQA